MFFDVHSDIFELSITMKAFAYLAATNTKQHLLYFSVSVGVNQLLTCTDDVWKANVFY